MTTRFERADNDHAWAAVRETTSRVFGMEAPGPERYKHWETYAAQVGRENFRVLKAGGEVVASLCVFRAGQWFGGASVPMGGVAAVGVEAEHRGRGYAATLVSEQLRELRDEGIPLSTLYASTQGPYRKVGFEQAGTCCGWSIPTTALSPGPHDLPVERIAPDDLLLRGLHRLRAASQPGTLDRNEGLWVRVAHERSNPVHAYLIGTRDDPHGYVVYEIGRSDDGRQILTVRDAVALTAAGARRLWTLFADHRSMARELKWNGPAGEPWLMGLSEQRETMFRHERWLLRIVDVAKALSTRGYPVDAEAELHLEITDPVLADNHGRFVLRVADGTGTVEPGGRGDLQATVGGLAPLYSGLFRASVLARIGRVDGSPSALAAADRLFGGPEPWMSDRF